MRICVLGAATSNHVLQRAKAFQDYGHDVSMISPSVASDSVGLNIVACPRPYRGGLYSRIKWFLCILDAVRTSKADVYHAHYAAEPTTWAAWILGKHPLVITVMGGDVLFNEQGTLGVVGRWLTRMALRSADLVTVKSSLLGEVVANFGVFRERILPVVWGVDGHLFHPDPEGGKARRQAWGVTPRAKVIFSPRMLKPLYNQLLMIDALKQVIIHEPDAVLVLSTYQEDTQWRTLVDARISELGLEKKVIFVPAVSSVDMAASYSAAQVVLSLPPSDGTPQSVMEAMACGVPVVMTDLERFKPLFTHRKTCWFTELEAAAVAEGIVTLLRDDELHLNVSQNSITLVREEADFESQTRMVETHLKKLAGLA